MVLSNKHLNLRGRHLEGAIFYFADLRKADLRKAYLQGASLFNAKLQGTWFYQAQLQGADLSQAKLQGASLDTAHLQGASLEQVELHGALVSNARLQGASLRGAQLQGAVVSNAQLQGASLKDAKLQGVDFSGSLLAGTDMGNADVWYLNLEGATLTEVSEDNLNPKAYSNDEFAGLKDYVKKEVPEGIQHDPALDLIEKLNPDKVGPEASQTQALEKGRAASEAAYQEALERESSKISFVPATNPPLTFYVGLHRHCPTKNLLALPRPGLLRRTLSKASSPPIAPSPDC